LKRFKRLDRAVLNLPIAKDKKDKVLKLANGKPVTARGLVTSQTFLIYPRLLNK